jgi:predicted nicotinamide N-methyase
MAKSFKFRSKIFTLGRKESPFLFYHPSDADELLETITDEQANLDKYQPYWMEHWPSAEVFFNYIFERTFPAPLKVLELGCGLGTLSVALLTAGHTVYSVDISLDACIYCHSNIELNKLQSKVICSDMRLLPFKTPNFDLIIASDILYEERMEDMFLDSISNLVTENTRVWIADPCRRGWDSFKAKALKRLFAINTLHSHKSKKSGLKVEIIELTSTSCFFAGDKTDCS